MDVQALRDGVEELVLEQSAAAWRSWYQAEPWDPGAELAARAELFTPASVAMATEAGDELLARHLLWQSVALGTQSAVGRYVRVRNTVAVRQADRTLLVGEVGHALAVEPDRAVRKQLWDDFVPVLRLSAPAFVGVLEATAEAGADHGHADGFALACALTRTDPESAIAAAEAVLAQTETPWRQALSVAAELAGVPGDDVRPHDLSYVLRADDHEATFVAAGALPLAGRTFSKLGLDLTIQEGVETLEDPHAASGRAPRAFALKVPGDIRMGASPRDGLAWFRAFLTELGRAQHLAHTAPGTVTQTFPLGLRGVTDAAGRVVSNWMSDPGFLVANGMPPTPASAVAGHARLEALHEVRTAAAVTLWHRDLAAGADPVQAWLNRALIPPDAEDAPALPDRLDAVYALDALQLRLLTATTEARLHGENGPEWWWSEAAGAGLFEMWSQGQRKSATELIHAMLGPGATLASGAELI